MSVRTKIEWTRSPDGSSGATWNPIRARVKGSDRWGYHCERISPGCVNCYACSMNGRTLPAWGTGLDYTVPNREKVEIFLDEKELLKPLSWRKPKTIFPCSMTDAFAGFVPDWMLDRMFAVAALCSQHRFLFLTKRAKRMREYCAYEYRWAQVEGAATDLVGRDEAPALATPERRSLPNCWLGVSVENQQYADERIPLLLQTPAAVRWISAEPLLSEISFRWAKWHDYNSDPIESDGRIHHRHLAGLKGIDWVIVGGESGPKARPMHPDWARSLRDQCVAAGVPFFFKQWGEYLPQFQHRPIAEELPNKRAMVQWPDGAYAHRVGKKAAGRLLDGREWNEMPEVAR